MAIWVILVVTVLTAKLIMRVVFFKLVLPFSCRETITHDIRHEWEHFQLHLISDAFANGLG